MTTKHGFDENKFQTGLTILSGVHERVFCTLHILSRNVSCFSSFLRALKKIFPRILGAILIGRLSRQNLILADFKTDF